MQTVKPRFMFLRQRAGRSHGSGYRTISGTFRRAAWL